MNTYNITVANTSELEKYYDLEHFSDDTMIYVRGGLDGKSKYNKDSYEFRTTYPLGQLKQIISVMHDIESGINPDWSDLTKAKYVYDTIGGMMQYNYNREEYKTQQSSNLTSLISRSPICAGYALIFKELMDRQNIGCDYIRGDATNSSGKTEKHAWNVLQIDGKNIPIDLTWDSSRIKRGEEIKYFGNDPLFHNSHRPDFDEKKYVYSILTEQDLKRAEYTKYQPNKQNMNYKTSRSEVEAKKEILENAIYTTYKKQEKLYGHDKAVEGMKTALEKYINNEGSSRFTRDGDARKALDRNLTPENALFCIADEYVERLTRNHKRAPIPKLYGEGQLKFAVQETMSAYDKSQARRAMIEYATSGNRDFFTNRGQTKARTSLQYSISPSETLDLLISEMVESTIERKKEMEKTVQGRINERLYGGDDSKTHMYDEDDFELTAPPKGDTFERAVKWIEDRQMKKEKDNSQER